MSWCYRFFFCQLVCPDTLVWELGKKSRVTVHLDAECISPNNVFPNPCSTHSPGQLSQPIPAALSSAAANWPL